MNASSVRVTWQWTSSDPAPSCFNTTCVTYHPEGGRESSLQLRDPAATETILTGIQSNTCYTITVVATAGEHRRESVITAVLLPVVLQGMSTITVCVLGMIMNSMCLYTQNLAWKPATCDLPLLVHRAVYNPVSRRVNWLASFDKLHQNCLV